MTAVAVICERCGIEPSEGWPGSKGGELCQDCWEAESSDAWWEELKRVQDWQWSWEVPPSMVLAAALNLAAGTEGLE